MKRGLAIPALALVAGCSDHLIALVSGAPWTSAIVQIEAGLERSLTAYEGGGPIRIETTSPDVELIAALYAVPLADLELVPGPIELTGARPLPGPRLSALALHMVDRDVISTEILPGSDPRLDDLRLPNIHGVYCESTGRCVEISGDSACVAACDPPPDRDAPQVEPPAAPMLPAPAEPPVIACPASWDPQTCAPPLPLPRVVCPSGEVQWRDAATCAPIGARCPANGWPARVPLGLPVRWVSPDRSVLGPGGEATHGTIAEALVGAPADVVLALAVGAHPGGFDLDRTQALIGACASATILEAGGTIRGSSSITGVTLRGAVDVGPIASLAVTQSVLGRIDVRGSLQAREVAFLGPGRAISALPGGQVEIVRMAAESTVPELLVSDGATIDARDLVVASATTGAIVARNGGTIILREAALFGAEGRAESRGRLVLEDVILSADARRIGPLDGLVVDGATLAASRVGFDRSFRVAVLARNSHARLADVWLRDLASSNRAALLDFSQGSTLSLDRATLASFDGLGILLEGGAVGRISHVRVHGAHADEPLAPALAGVRVAASAKLRMDHAEIRGIRGIGLEIIASGTATVSDLIVAGVPVFGLGGAAVQVHQQASLVLHRAQVDNSAGFAALTHGHGTRSVLADIDVDARPRVAGQGVSAVDGAHTTVDRLRVRGDVETAFSIARGSSGTARDLTLVAGDGRLDQGAMLIIAGSEVELARVRIEGTPRAYVFLYGSRVTASDISIVAAQATLDAVRFPAIDVAAGEVRLSRVRIEKCNGPALWIREGVTTAEDVRVDGTDAQPGGARDHSINVTTGAQVTLRRLIVNDMLGTCLSAFNAGSRLEVVDGLCQRSADAGVRADQGSTVVLEGARFEDTVGNGLFVSKGGTLMGKEVQVARVARARLGLGFGLVVSSGSSAALEGFSIAEAREAGLRINLDIEGGSPMTVVRLTDGVIRGSRAAISAPIETMATVELLGVRLLENSIDRE